METIKNAIIDGFRIYLIHLVLIITTTILYIGPFVLDIEPRTSYFDFIKGFYYRGMFGDFEMWRLHVFAIFLCILMGIMNEFDSRNQF